MAHHGVEGVESETGLAGAIRPSIDQTDARCPEPIVRL
jgi:hypothetical protein